MSKQTITITFGDQAENNVGMQKIGKLADEGFTRGDLENAKLEFEKDGYKCEMVDLNIETTDFPSAAILIIRNGVEAFVDTPDLIKEHSLLDVDKKALMRGRVVNKLARHNLCFDDEAQEPDYASGRGRIVSFNQVPGTKAIRDGLEDYFGEKGKDLKAEANYYYDVEKCYIGFHGDAERRKTIAVRMGEAFPLYYQWYRKSEKVGEMMEFMINSGDMYVMAEKATGFDWRRKLVPTLRHAAGSKKALKL